jgi:putative hemolysin
MPFETLAGLILFELGHCPVEGEQVKRGGYLPTCVKVTRTAIRRVKIEPAEQANIPEE